ncbi:MAG: SRPBCC domain-containing protein [Planctomycetota bacterium]
MVAPSEDYLVIRRRYAASPEAVFSMWTRAELLSRWLRPSPEYTHLFVEVDATVGGRYRIAFKSPEGKVDVVGGEFLDVSSPSRLVFTWKWEPPNEHSEIDTQVTVDLKEVHGETELVLTHRISDRSMKEEHCVGWSGALDQIPALIPTGGGAEEAIPANEGNAEPEGATASNPHNRLA